MLTRARIGNVRHYRHDRKQYIYIYIYANILFHGKICNILLKNIGCVFLWYFLNHSTLHYIPRKVYNTRHTY